MSGIPTGEQTYEHSLEAVERIGAAVVLKQYGTEIYFYNDDVYESPTGTPAMVTGGMGDTPVGVITGFIGQFDSLREAVTNATYMHSFIGEKLSDTMYIVPSSCLISEIPYVMEQFEG